MVDKPIPSWLRGQLTGESQAKIAAAVHNAEQTTSGEIVPIIVRSSSTTGHVPLLSMSLVLLLLLAIDLPARYAPHGIDNWHWSLLECVGAIIAGWLLAKLAFVKRALVPIADQTKQVHRRAEVEFYEAGIDKTNGSTGILLFVSMLERRAVVLADKGIADKLPPDIWQGVVGLLVKASQRRDLGHGLAEAITLCGELLSKHFPIAASDVNELEDALIIKE